MYKCKSCGSTRVKYDDGYWQCKDCNSLREPSLEVSSSPSIPSNPEYLEEIYRSRENVYLDALDEG